MALENKQVSNQEKQKRLVEEAKTMRKQRDKEIAFVFFVIGFFVGIFTIFISEIFLR